MTPPLTSISIVSHGQMALVSSLLADLQKHCNPGTFDVILTLNIPEPLPALLAELSFVVKVLHNAVPLGFGENHNRAFAHARGAFFCVLNPDVRIESDVFPPLALQLQSPLVGVVAPKVVNPQGAQEDSARRFPTPLKILCKVFRGCRGSDYVMGQVPVYPDWVAGMFMLFRREVYQQVGGFNEKFFLYYEDVDLCARLWLQGLQVALIPQVQVIHQARRSSHANVAYLRLHVASMLRFFCSTTFVKVVFLRRRFASGPEGSAQ